LNLTKLFALVIGMQAVSAWGADVSPFQSEQDKINYGIGVQIARNFKNQGIDVNLDMVMRGMKDGLSKERLLIPEPELRKMMMAFQNQLREKQAAAKRAAALEHQKQQSPPQTSPPLPGKGAPE
jgi:hypothetical protein